MTRLLCIMALLSLGVVPAARAMDHAHHAGHGAGAGHETASDPTTRVDEAAMPAPASCQVPDDAGRSMQGHGACLGCCPPASPRGDAVTTDRPVPCAAAPFAVHTPLRDNEVVRRVQTCPPEHSPGNFTVVLRL